MHRNRITRIGSTLALVVITGTTGAWAQSPTCGSKASHQFDFWIGDWDVTSGGKPAGRNSIRPILDGCVLQENWAGVRGSAGTSLNFFDPQRGKWRQFWVWRNGTTLELEGAFADGKMVLEGDSTDRQGKSVRNRITWYDNSDGTVRQLWQTSSADSEGWTTVFDGLYRKRGDDGESRGG